MHDKLCSNYDSGLKSEMSMSIDAGHSTNSAHLRRSGKLYLVSQRYLL